MRFAPGSAPEAVADDPVGQVLAAPLRSGEPVTDVRLVGPELTAGQPGLVAVPVRLPDPGMVALLDVGDRIDLLATDPQEGGASVVATDVPVLAIPAADDRTSASGLPGRLVVVGAEAAQVTRAGRGSGPLVRDVHVAGPLASRREHGSLGTKEQHMTGFKNFILRGNLVELAVAFIMAAAFAAVVTDLHRHG